MSELVLLILVFVYLLPTFVALSRKKRATSPIFIVNFFLGWTFLGWVVALVWSLMPYDEIELAQQQRGKLNGGR